MQKMLYTNEKSTELGEIKEGKKNRKVKGKNEGMAQLLCLTSNLQPV